MKKISVITAVILAAVLLTSCSVIQLKKDVPVENADAQTDAETEQAEISEPAPEELPEEQPENAPEQITDETAEPQPAPEQSENAVVPLTVFAGGRRLNPDGEDYYDYNIPSVYYSMVKLGDADKKAYPLLGNVIDMLNDQKFRVQLAEFRNLTDMASDESLSFLDDITQLESTDSVCVRRADSRVLSLLYRGYGYYGGVHGLSYFDGRNFDTATGAYLDFYDVVNDTTQLAAAVEQQLSIFYPGLEMFPETEISTVLSDVNSFSFTLDNNGITIYFSPYTLAPYAWGSQVVTLSYAEYPDIVKEQYKETAPSHGMQIMPDVPLYYDVTGDGKLDEIVCMDKTDLGQEVNDNVISINGTSYNFNSYGFDTNFGFLHSANGKNVILASYSSVGWSKHTDCIVVGETAERVCSICEGFPVEEYELNGTVHLSEIPTNADNFRLHTVTQEFCTSEGSHFYSIGDVGMPVLKDELFVFDEDSKLIITALSAVETEIFDMNTRTVTGKRTLAAGENVMFYSTDNQKYAYLLCSDGTVCRFDESYWREINPMKNLSQLFDGLFFAG